MLTKVVCGSAFVITGACAFGRNKGFHWPIRGPFAIGMFLRTSSYFDQLVPIHLSVRTNQILRVTEQDNMRPSCVSAETSLVAFGPEREFARNRCLLNDHLHSVSQPLSSNNWIQRYHRHAWVWWECVICYNPFIYFLTETWYLFSFSCFLVDTLTRHLAFGSFINGICLPIDAPGEISNHFGYVVCIFILRVSSFYMARARAYVSIIFVKYQTLNGS